MAQVLNRGPAAAADNRRALLDAARRLFAEQGYHVPYSAIAREAGVGQGSLYRHFPDRLDLALAIFAANLAELEQIASESDDPHCFSRLWRRLVEQTLDSTAFVEMVVDARQRVEVAELAERWPEILREPLRTAQAAKVIDTTLTVEDLALAERMVYGVIVTETDPSRARAATHRALELIHPSLTWSQEEPA